MINFVEVSPEFKRDLKPLLKKHHTLRSAIEDLQATLIENPFLGISYGHGIFKVRIADKSSKRKKRWVSCFILPFAKKRNRHYYIADEYLQLI